MNSYSPSQEQIVNALNYLESAITTYKSAQKYGMSGYAGDKSTLQSLINTGYDLYYNSNSSWVAPELTEMLYSQRIHLHKKSWRITTHHKMK